MACKVFFEQSDTISVYNTRVSVAMATADGQQERWVANQRYEAPIPAIAKPLTKK